MDQWNALFQATTNVYYSIKTARKQLGTSYILINTQINVLIQYFVMSFNIKSPPPPPPLPLLGEICKEWSTKLSQGR